ncbi:MAG: hypothetical protein JRG76_06825 [Deltaproteobacteria bacterium]|nr:hypothetical protein [Deltaproteobacteria bacterium]MBW2414208.1 hypothetical protein [Deltaproteobacteria bacterium]
MTGSETDHRNIERAAETRQPIRIHTSDGEVLVARILNCDDEEVVYAVITSSRPEKYAVCDAIGFSIPRAAVASTRLLRDP